MRAEDFMGFVMKVTDYSFGPQGQMFMQIWRCWPGLYFR